MVKPETPRAYACSPTTRSLQSANRFRSRRLQGDGADAPDRFLSSMAKNERTGRIFLDHLRSDRMATAVAPLSPRGRPGAPLWMPVTWSQVKRGLVPSKFTVRTVPALVKKLTAWADYCDGERPLAAAIKRLGKV
jgi:bifunctional non-homologous end joining protein LigD